ncbi:MAG: four helix bundle protein [Cyclobacteriaceae bacterium]|nr:four helix bundle protein [Cyclobacteriaceae bacterium]
MKHAKSFKELEIYQSARQLAREIYELTKTFPREEKYSLTDQLRRSSRSVGAQIAEAWAKRRYEKHFVSKLTDADGEQMETQHWVESARDCALLGAEQTNELIAKYEMLGRKLYNTIEKAHLFCSGN